MGGLGIVGSGLGFVGAFIPGYGTLAATAGAVLSAIDGPDGEQKVLLPPGVLWEPGGLAWGLPWIRYPELAGWEHDAHPVSVGPDPTIWHLIGSPSSPAYAAARNMRGPWGGVGQVLPQFGSAGEALRRGGPEHFDTWDSYIVEEKQPGSSGTYRGKRRTWQQGTTRAAHTCQNSLKGCSVNQGKAILEKIRAHYQEDAEPDFQFYLDQRTWGDSSRGQGVKHDAFGALYPYLGVSFSGSAMPSIKADLQLWSAPHSAAAKARFGYVLEQALETFWARRAVAVQEAALDYEEWLAWRDAAKSLAAKETASAQLTDEFETQFESYFGAGHSYLDSISMALANITANVAGVQQSVLEAAIQNPADNDAVQELLQETAAALGSTGDELQLSVQSEQLPTSQAPAPAAELERKPLPLVAAAIVAGVLLLA